MNMRAWTTGSYPTKNHVVEVWHPKYQTILAVWTGDHWETPDGMRLSEITHWRERQ